MFGRKREPKPEEITQDLIGEITKDNPPVGNTCELMHAMSVSFAKAFTQTFCPWVDVDSLSEEEVERFSKASFFMECLITGQATITTPEDEAAFDKIFGNLIPEPTDEQLEEYRQMLEAYCAEEDENPDVALQET